MCCSPAPSLKPAQRQRESTLLLHCRSPWVCSVKTLPTWYTQTTQGTPLYHLALVAKSAGVPELHGPVTIRKTVLVWPSPPGHSTNSRLKHNPYSRSKKPVYLAWSFSLGTGFRFPIYLQAKEVLQGNISRDIPSLHTPLAFLQLDKTYQKEAYKLIWNPNFCSCCPGDTSRSCVQDSKDYNWSQIALCLFACFKGCCLRI